MKRRVLAITLAIVLAVLGTAGVLAYVHAADARALAGQRAVTVLVAQGKIPSGTTAGTALQSGMLVSQQLPASAVPSEAVSSITPAVSGLVTLAVAPYIAWYAYRSMRIVYGQSPRLTIGKLVVLSFFYLVSGGLMLALVSLYSIFTL